MFIDKAKIKELEMSLKIELTEEEFGSVLKGIEELTTRLEELEKVNVDNYKPTYSVFQNEMENQFASDEDEEMIEVEKITENLNNFDGSYFKISQVINDD